MRRANGLVAAAVLVLGIPALACAPVFARPNHRRLIWDGASAEMELPRPDQGYASLWIRLTEPRRDLSLRMPDGRWLRTAGLEPADLASFASPLQDTVDASGARRMVVPFDRGACESRLGFAGGSIVFVFRGDELIEITLSSNVDRPEACRPGLGESDGARAHVMPLREDDLVALLGPFLRKEEYYGGL